MIGAPLSFNAHGASKKLTAAQAAAPATSIAAAKRAGGFIWLGLTNPTEGEPQYVAPLAA